MEAGSVRSLGEARVLEVDRRKMLEDRVSRTMIQIVGHRVRPAIRLRRGAEHVHDAIGLGIRQRLEQQRIQHAEDRRVRAHAEDDGQHRGDREPRRLAQAAQAVANILHRIACPAQRQHIARPLLGLLDTADRDARTTVRFGVCHAALRVGPRLHRYMKRELVVEVLLQATTKEDGCEASADRMLPAAPLHVRPPSKRAHD